MSDSVDDFNHKLILIRDKRENTAIPRMEKRHQWSERLIQKPKERPKVNDNYILRKKDEVMRVLMRDGLLRKRSTV